MPKEFEEKSVIVTGSSSGIGEAIAIHFAQNGAKVTLCGRDQDRLQEAVQKCQQASGEVSSEKFLAVCGDITDNEIQEKIVNNSVDKFGCLDVLVCNHGVISGFGKFLESTEESYDKIMNTNLRSVYFLIQKSVPHLEKTKGSIVNVSSIGSTSVGTSAIPYCMSKAALDHLTRCLALDLASKGIRVNAINPTAVVTNIGRDGKFPKDHFENMGKIHPLEGRCSTVDEQADAVTFLASDRAKFITGQCLKVDGGLTLGTRPL